MEWISKNHEAIAWILLWAWIAFTIFIFSYSGRLSVKIYAFNILLLAGFIYLKCLYN